MKKEKKSHLNLWIYVMITVCILSSSIAYSALNASVKITGDTGINFKENSSEPNGKGVYERKGTENQQYPIYYYRGEVDNNNVIFANYCWKIVRTTEIGGIKLIFNGTPSSSNTCNNTGTASQLTTKAFNSSDNSPTYVGYKYGTVYRVTEESTLSGGVYGSSVSYNGGTYTLENTSNKLDNTHHYACGRDKVHTKIINYFVNVDVRTNVLYTIQ